MPEHPGLPPPPDDPLVRPLSIPASRRWRCRCGRPRPAQPRRRLRPALRDAARLPRARAAHAGLLERLRAHLRVQGCDAQAREAARDVLRYFDIAAPLHHEDEELHVFPPLLAQGPAPVVDLVRQLQRDHAAMAMLWSQARVPLAAVAGGEPGALPWSPEQERALDDFADLYAGHIDRGGRRWPIRWRRGCCRRPCWMAWGRRWRGGGAPHSPGASSRLRAPAPRYSPESRQADRNQSCARRESGGTDEVSQTPFSTWWNMCPPACRRCAAIRRTTGSPWRRPTSRAVNGACFSLKSCPFSFHHDSSTGLR